MDTMELEVVEQGCAPPVGEAEVAHHHDHDDGHAHEGEAPLSLWEEIKLEAAERSGTTAKNAELQAVCGCGACPQCLTVTVWNVGSLIAPAIKVMARRRRDRAH